MQAKPFPLLSRNLLTDRNEEKSAPPKISPTLEPVLPQCPNLHHWIARALLHLSAPCAGTSTVGLSPCASPIGLKFSEKNKPSFFVETFISRDTEAVVKLSPLPSCLTCLADQFSQLARARCRYFIQESQAAFFSPAYSRLLIYRSA